MDAALQLMKIATRVYVINVAQQLTGDPIMQEKVTESKVVTVLNDACVTAVFGEKMVAGIRVKRKEIEEELSVGGVFVEIGLVPNSEFAKDVKKNELGEIVVNARNETSLPAIFAAGDVTDVPEKQIIIAAGEGSKATLSVFRYLSRRPVTPSPNKIIK